MDKTSKNNPIIFLNYSREDRTRVESLYQILQDIGFNPWMDCKDLLPGQDWKAALAQAIRHAALFIACLSNKSINKRGIVQWELREAMELWKQKLEDDIFLIPVRLDSCEIPTSLTRFHYVDLFAENGLQKLKDAIRYGLDRLVQSSLLPAEAPDTSLFFANREDFLKLCHQQVAKEIHNYIGGVFSTQYYIHRDYDDYIKATIYPWDLLRSQSSEDDRSTNNPILALWDRYIIEIRERLAASDLQGFLQFIDRWQQSIKQMEFLYTQSSYHKILSHLEFCHKIQSLKQARHFFNTLIKDIPLFDLVASETKDSKDLKALYALSIEQKDAETLINLNTYFKVVCQEYESQQNTILGPIEHFHHIDKDALKRNISIVSQCSELHDKAEKTLRLLQYRQIFLVADGGKGKTWTLCFLATELSQRSPVLFFSAKNSMAMRQDGLLHCLANTFSRLRPSQAICISSQINLTLINCLKKDEQLTVIIDGMDWRSDSKIITERLLQYQSEIENLPIRLIFSCRRDYWFKIAAIYEYKDNHLLLSTLIHDFSDEEYKTVVHDLELILGDKRKLFEKIDFRILRDPLIFGIIKEIGLGIPKKPARPLNGIDLCSAFLNKIISQTANRTGVEQSYCRFVLKLMFQTVLEDAGEYLSGNPGKINRSYLIRKLKEKTGQFHPQVLNEFVETTLLQARGEYLWFVLDMILEYGIALNIVDNCYDRNSGNLNSEFFIKYDLRKEWLPGQVSIMAFVACFLRQNGIRLWELMPYAFSERAAWLNLVLLNIPSEGIDLNLLKQQLQASGNHLYQIKLAALRRELPDSERDRFLLVNEKSEIKEGVNSLLAAIEQGTQPPDHKTTGHFFRYFFSENDFVEEKARTLIKEASFWLRNLSQLNIPLIANPNIPVEARKFLTECAVQICLSPYVPVELVGDVYLAFAASSSKLELNFSDLPKLKILISDDEDMVTDVLTQIINRIRDNNRINPNLLSVDLVPNGNGDLTLEWILADRFSVLLVDVLKPGLSGPEIIKKYRQIKGEKDSLQTVLFTGYGGCEEICQDVGADLYIGKPFGIKMYRLVFGAGARDKRHILALKEKIIEAVDGRTLLPLMDASRIENQWDTSELKPPASSRKSEEGEEKKR